MAELLCLGNGKGADAAAAQVFTKCAVNGRRFHQVIVWNPRIAVIQLLTKLCNCVNESLIAFLRTVNGLTDGLLDAVMVIHTFGDYAKKWFILAEGGHPHIHLIAADGLFTRNGTFYFMPKVDFTPLAEIFRAKVLSILKKEGKIDDALIRMLTCTPQGCGLASHLGIQRG